MSDAYTTLWTHDCCRDLRRAGRIGERPPVVFSGVHSSMPSYVSVDPGDDVYPLRVDRRVVYVVARLRVRDKERLDCCGPEPMSRRDPWFPGHADWSALLRSSCTAAVVHVDATPIRFDVPVSGELLTRLTWRNRRGVTRGLKHVVDGRLERALGLQGIYRLTEESAAELATLVGSVPADSQAADPSPALTA